MYCRKCGKQIPDDSSFCCFCGENLSSDIKIEEEEHGKKRKVVFDGEIHKCPNCGEILDAFVTKCPSCGFELRGTKGGTNRVEMLVEKLEKAQTDDKKKELISNFYVPNTKEDILEFFTLAVSQVDDDNVCSEAWCSKLDQSLIKAKLSFGNSDEYKYLAKLYDDAMQKKKRADAKKHRLIRISIITGIILGVVATAFTIVGVIGVNHYGHDSPYFVFIMLGLLIYVAIPTVCVCLVSQNDDENKKNDNIRNSKGNSKNVVKNGKIEPKSTVKYASDNDEEFDNETNNENSSNIFMSYKEEFKKVKNEFSKSFKDMFK